MRRRGSASRFSVVTEQLPGGSRRTPSPAAAPSPTAHVLYLHGGGFMAPISAWQVRYAARMADALGARVVMPDYPLAPEHTWRDSHDDLVDARARLGAEGRRWSSPATRRAAGSHWPSRSRCATAGGRSRAGSC